MSRNSRIIKQTMVAQSSNSHIITQTMVAQSRNSHIITQTMVAQSRNSHIITQTMVAQSRNSHIITQTMVAQEQKKSHHNADDGNTGAETVTLIKAIIDKTSESKTSSLLGDGEHYSKVQVTLT